MVQKQTIIQLLETAVYAPSGDNVQPWEFEVSEGLVKVFLVSGKDETLYDFRARGSYMACGAVIENIVILAASEGLKADVTLFPDGSTVAEIRFHDGALPKHSLEQQIKRRSTNRKKYRGPVSSEHRDLLIGSLQDPYVRSVLIQTSQEIQTIAEAASVHERLLMEERHLHDPLFNMIRWTKAEEATRPGLFVETMELPPPVRFMFQYVLKHWAAVRLLNFFGLSRIAPKDTRKLYASAPLMAALLIQRTNSASFVGAGRVLQRAWLTATSCELYLQPMAAIPYLAARIKEDERTWFRKQSELLIKEAHQHMRTVCGAHDDEHIAMVVRIGYADPPSAGSSKLPPIIRGT